MPPPLDLAVVASWYPTFDDPAPGRFVADQVEALGRGGRVRPVVVSFEAAEVSGSVALRERLADLIAETASAAIAEAPDVFHRGVGQVPATPVARLPANNARTGSRPRLSAEGREAVVRALGRRWAGGDGTGLPPRPQLVHAHTAYPDGAAGDILARELGVPLVVTEHASFLDKLFAVPAIRERYGEVLAHADRVISVSRHLGARIVREFPEAAERLLVIPNAVDVDAFETAPLDGRQADELLYVGYRKATKGIETLLRAVAVARRARPGIRLRMIGGSTPALEAGWRALAGELGIADAVTFEPPADRAAVAVAMRRASLFVHASVFETFGVVAAEALASGTPVVATNSGGVTDILDDPGTKLGRIVPVDDAEAMGAAIAAALDARTTFDPAALRASVERRFAAGVVAGRLEAVYDEVLARHAARGDAVATAGDGRAGEDRPDGDRAERRTIVVAFTPARAARVDALPDAAPGFVLVTSRGAGGPADRRAGSIVRTNLHARLGVGLGRWPTDRVGKWVHAIRHPIAAARRRGILPGIDRLVIDDGGRAIRAALDATGSASARLVCVDGLDYLAAAAALADGSAIAAPGGIAWLGDALAESAGRGPGPSL
jgi:glycosyltransferase involved in cell wall biosynthesis